MAETEAAESSMRGLLMCVKKRWPIEAMEITKESEREVMRWAGEGVITPSPVLEPGEDSPTGSYYQVRTLEGTMTCVPGDFIIKGVEGEFYPCRRHIFLKTYDVLRRVV